LLPGRTKKVSISSKTIGFISVAEVSSAAAKQGQLNEGLMIWETTCTTIALIAIKDGLTADAWERNQLRTGLSRASFFVSKNSL